MSGYIINCPLGGYIEIEAKVDQNQAIDTLLERLSTPKPVLQAYARIIRESYRRDFAEGGRPHWAPLAPSTIAKKSAQGLPALNSKGRVPKRLIQRGGFGPENILIATGKLRDSYVQQGAVGHVEEYTEDSVSVGSSIPYAVKHQEGISPWLPARPVTITEKEKDEMLQVTNQHLTI